jgi:hypothetical protein
MPILRRRLGAARYGKLAEYNGNMEMNETPIENDLTAEDNSVEITNGENPFEDSE